MLCICVKRILMRIVLIYQYKSYKIATCCVCNTVMYSGYAIYNDVVSKGVTIIEISPLPS